MGPGLATTKGHSPHGDPKGGAMGGGLPAEAAAVLQAPTPNTGIVGVRLPLPLSKEEWVIAPLSSLAKLLITSLWIGLCVASGQVKGVEI